MTALIESTEDAVIAKRMDGVITDWNQGAERLYGYTAAEIVGRHVSTLLPPDRPQEVEHILERMSAGERIERFDTFRVHRDGRLIPVAVAICAMRNAAGELIGASTIARDLTDRLRANQLAQELAAAAQRQRQAVQLNDNVLQQLVIAQTNLGLGQAFAAAAAVDTALRQAQQLVDDLIGEGPVQPGDFVRSPSPARSSASSGPVRPAPDAGRPVRVLIADDDEDVRALLRMILQSSAEFVVIAEASDGQQAVDRALDAQPDVVLIDVSMPQMDGLTALPLIRRAAPAARVLVVSAFGSGRLGEAAAAQGADAYLEKTKLYTQLIPAVKAALGADSPER